MPLSNLSGGEKTGRSLSKVRNFSVIVSTADALLRFDEVEYKSTGKDLFDLICRTIGLRETDYFGLQYVDSKGDTAWLRNDKKIIDQDVPCKDVPRNFSFLVKFFPEDISQEIIQETTQHLFFLQIKQSILNMDIYCPPEATVLLASYAVQAKYGDYDATQFRSEMLSTEDLLPQRVIDQYQMTPDMWADKIQELYMVSQGMPRDEAEMEYMKIAQDLEMFAVNYFQIKNKRGTDLWLGVTTLGLNIYEKDNRLHPKVAFPWNEIKNISYKEKRFVIKLLDKKSTGFVFIAPSVKVNKLILELCVGNHSLFMKRRKPESMEVQQMRAQAREEKARKQIERAQLVREKKLREEAERQKEDLQQKFQELQDHFRQSQDALEHSEEAADLLAEKVRIAEEECSLLSQKAAEAEAEKQRIQMDAIRSEEEKLLMEMRARDAELIASKIVEECENRVSEAKQLKAELAVARLAEKAARDKYDEFVHNSIYRGLSPNYQNVQGGGQGSGVGGGGRGRGMGRFDSSENGFHVPGHEVSYSRSMAGCGGGGMIDIQSDFNDLRLVPTSSATAVDMTEGSADLLPATDMDTLSREIEKERVDYLEKSKNLQEQLKELKSEIEVLKVEEKQSHFDSLHEQNSARGENKYSTLGKIKGGTAKSRVQFYEEL